MAAEIKKEIQLEIAHVLFIDIVGYSKLSINVQNAAVDELTRIVRATEQFQKAEASERLIKIATGDGMALVFYASPEAPVRCAVEISRALKEHPGLKLRMGIHSGPVSGVIDVTGRTNLAGARRQDTDVALPLASSFPFRSKCSEQTTAVQDVGSENELPAHAET